MEVIKKYTNRKLYSLKTNSYVTLEYINDLVKTNQKFQVINNSDLSDITKDTLKQSLSLLNLDRTTLTNIIRSH